MTEPVAGTSAPGVFSPGRRMLTSGLVMIVTLVAFESLAISTVMPLVEDDLGDLWLYGWVFSAFFLGQPHRHRGGRHRRRPHAPGGPLRRRPGGVRHRPGRGRPGPVDARARPRAGAAGPRRRGDAGHLLRLHRSGYPHEQRPTMFALISSAWVIPSVAGPALAGVIGSALGWRWVFLGLLPLCGVIGLMALAGVARIPAPDEPSGESNLLNARDGRRRARRCCSPGSGPGRCSWASVWW